MRPRINCIMAIDDDEATNFYTQVMLEDSGSVNHIRLMQGGKEALEYLDRCEEPGNEGMYPSPDLIFLDINMPAMNGWEFLEEYRQRKHTNRIVIVMLTTSLFPEDRNRAEHMPEINGFENKPLTQEKIQAILDRYFLDLAARA